MSWFVYVDWTTENVPRPFYVGKGNARRTQLKIRNRKHQAIAAHYGMHREIVLSTTKETLAFRYETFLIDLHATFVYDNLDRWGANFTRGGDGNSGWVPSAETRRRISVSKTGTRLAPWVVEQMRGRETSDATKAKLSAAGKGRPKSAEHKRHISLGSKNRPVVSDETRQRQSDSMKRAWAEGRKKP